MADVSQQTFFQIGDGASPEEFLNLGEVVGISGPSLSVTALDVTNLADTAKAFIASEVYDGGEITLEVNFEPDTQFHADMIVDMLAFTPAEVTIQYADAGTTTYTLAACIITGFEAGASVDEKLSGTFTIKVGGAVSIA